MLFGDGAGATVIGRATDDQHIILSTHIHAVYPLAEGAAALNAIARREVKGKVILRV